MVYKGSTAPNGKYFLMNTTPNSVMQGKVYAIVEVNKDNAKFIKHFFSPTYNAEVDKQLFSDDVDFIEVTPLSKALFDIP
jgi:hypothetical protein